MQQNSNVKRLVETAVLLALGFVLSTLKVKLVAAGGSITIVSMLPIVILANKYGVAWGTLSGFVHGILQIIEDGGIFPPTNDVLSYAMVLILDYALAWAAVGLIAGLLRNTSSKPYISISLGCFFGIAGRFLCSFMSGVIIWRVYAPEGQSPWIYSLLTNGMVLLPEMIIHTVVGYLLFRVPVMQEQVKA